MLTFFCVNVCAACSLGQVSSMSVATGTYVRIPNTAQSSEGQDCFLGCHCDSKGELEHCRPLPCLQRRHCMLGAGNKQGGCWKQTGWVLGTNRMGNKEGGCWKQTGWVLGTNRMGNKEGGYWKLTGWVLETNGVGTGNKQGGYWKQTGWVLETNRVGTGNKQGGKQRRWVLEINRVGAGNKVHVGPGMKQGGYWKQTRWETRGWVLETRGWVLERICGAFFNHHSLPELLHIISV